MSNIDKRKVLQVDHVAFAVYLHISTNNKEIRMFHFQFNI